MTPSQIVSEHYSEIKAIAASVASHRGLQGEDINDFIQDVFFKLLEDDGKILRAFQGKSSLMTYLHTVINRICIDEIRKKKGRKATPSAVAVKTGEIAVVLEQLITQKHYKIDEAYEILITNYHFLKLTSESLSSLQEVGTPMNVLQALGPLTRLPYQIKNDFLDSVKALLPAEQMLQYQATIVQHAVIPERAEIHTMAAQFSKSPKVAKPEVLQLEEWLQFPASDPLPDNEQEQTETLKMEQKVGQIITEMSKALSLDDRLILKMRFEENCNVSTIAKIVGKKRHQIDNRIQHIFADFRSRLKDSGIDEEEIKEWIRKNDY